MTVREQNTEDHLAPPRPASLPHEVMALLPDHWPTELPLARVTTCGPSVSITVLHQLTPTPAYGPPDPTVMAGGYASTAQLLLAVLASRPHGAASKDWLSEALITRRSVLANPDDPDERTPLQRVENPVSVLRHLLVPPVLRTLPTIAKLRLQLVSFYRSTRESGCGYRLAGMPLIWVDVLAIEESITRAHALEQFGSDAQREWEAAYTLLMQGEFAEHAPYSDWALWRRQEQERQRWECVQALHGYYRKQGEPGEREATRILQRYWQNHMSNEDAFRPLVELLGKQEGFGQAEEAYTHLTQALEEEGRVPDRRTQEVMVWLRALQIQRTPSQEQSISSEKEPENVSLPLSQVIKQGIIEAMQDLDGTSDLLTGLRKRFDHLPQELEPDARLQEQDQKETPDAAQIQPPSFYSSMMVDTPISLNTLSARINQFQKGSHASMDIVQNRRQLLHHLLMIGSTALVLSPYAILSPDADEQLHLSVLEELETVTAKYWRLCTNASLDLLGNLSEHFRTIVNLLERTLPHKTGQRLCSLSGEGAQILGKTLFDLQEYALAWSYYTFSLKAAQAASNHDLWAAGIGRMSLLLLYWEHPQKALSLLQEIHQLTIQSVRVVCWLNAVEAEVYASLVDAEACDAALERAREILKNESLGEDRYATGFSASRFAGYEGACFIRLHQPERALLALQQALSFLDPQAIRRQSTLLTDMGVAYAQLGNIQRACQFASQALSLTKQTKSRSVLERVRMIRSKLEAWKETNEVQELEKLVDMTLTHITV